MALGVAEGSLIAAGIAATAQAGNAIAQAKLNRRNRKWQEEMYARQQADQLSAWERQNTYNSPQEQMKRLQEAGLNPNLVYGSGSAQQPAGPLQTPDVQPPSQRAPTFDGSGMANQISAYYDTRIKQATESNLKAQNDVLLQEALLKEATRLNTEADTSRKGFDLGLEKSLEVYTSKKRQFDAENTSVDYYQKEHNLRVMQEMEEEQKQIIRETLKQHQSNSQLKAWEARLSESGLTPNSAIYYRLMEMALTKLGLMKPINTGASIIKSSIPN